MSERSVEHDSATALLTLHSSSGSSGFPLEKRPYTWPLAPQGAKLIEAVCPVQGHRGQKVRHLRATAKKLPRILNESPLTPSPQALQNRRPAQLLS